MVLSFISPPPKVVSASIVMGTIGSVKRLPKMRIDGIVRVSNIGYTSADFGNDFLSRVGWRFAKQILPDLDNDSFSKMRCC